MHSIACKHPSRQTELHIFFKVRLMVQITVFILSLHAECKLYYTAYTNDAGEKKKKVY